MSSTSKKTPPLILAENVSLHFPVYHQRDRSLMKNPFALISELYIGNSNRVVKPILSNINLTVYKGERIGVIGANGAGKSTLLRLLARIYPPSGGCIAVNGSAEGLFDISLGMLPEATGLENIYLRGLQMGLNMEEIRSMVGDVIEFSELEPFINLPHNTYSAGMRLRLAFSISTVIKPDILLLDEWIGAGDAAFRDKVSQRMNSLMDSSKALVLASHNDRLIQTLCERAIVLDGGQIIFDGSTDEALNFYNTRIERRKAG
jgi:ABC-type polysaccharide/polyol phosphate transport system ATPase subunit